jgi:hypothetical protein
MYRKLEGLTRVTTESEVTRSVYAHEESYSIWWKVQEMDSDIKIHSYICLLSMGIAHLWFVAPHYSVLKLNYKQQNTIQSGPKTG